MSWSKRWQGRYVVIDPKNPSALGICDYSNVQFNHKDMIKQMEWRGDNLVWTGFLVGKPFADKPQPQNRPPKVKDDPRPVTNPRLPSPYSDPNVPVILPPNQLVAKLRTTNWNWPNQ